MNDSRVVKVMVPPDGDLQKIELSRRRTVEDLKQKLLVLNYKLPGTKTDYKLLYNDIDLEDSKIFCESHPDIASTWNEDSIVLVTLFSKNPLPANLTSPRASVGVEIIDKPKRRLSIGDVPTTLTLQTPTERMAWLEERRKSRGGELSNSLKQLEQQWQKEEQDLKIKEEERKKRREDLLAQQKLEEEEFKRREEERQRIRIEREAKKETRRRK